MGGVSRRFSFSKGLVSGDSAVGFAGEPGGAEPLDLDQ